MIFFGDDAFAGGNDPGRIVAVAIIVEGNRNGWPLGLVAHRDAVQIAARGRGFGFGRGGPDADGPRFEPQRRKGGRQLGQGGFQPLGGVAFRGPERDGRRCGR